MGSQQEAGRPGVHKARAGVHCAKVKTIPRMFATETTAMTTHRMILRQNVVLPMSRSVKMAMEDFVVAKSRMAGGCESQDIFMASRTCASERYQTFRAPPTDAMYVMKQVATKNSIYACWLALPCALSSFSWTTYHRDEHHPVVPAHAVDLDAGIEAQA